VPVCSSTKLLYARLVTNYETISDTTFYLPRDGKNVLSFDVK